MIPIEKFMDPSALKALMLSRGVPIEYWEHDWDYLDTNELHDMWMVARRLIFVLDSHLPKFLNFNAKRVDALFEVFLHMQYLAEGRVYDSRLIGWSIRAAMWMSRRFLRCVQVFAKESPFMAPHELPPTIYAFEMWAMHSGAGHTRAMSIFTATYPEESQAAMGNF